MRRKRGRGGQEREGIFNLVWHSIVKHFHIHIVDIFPYVIIEPMLK